MRPTIRSELLLAAAFSALVALSTASGAQAQAQPLASAQDGHRAPRGMNGQMQAQMQAMHEAHERQRAQDLRTVLRLRPDQDAALTAFLQSHKRPDGAAKSAERRGPPGAAATAMTTPQRLDEMARREAERASMRQRHTDALRAFYAALNPEQRQVFDALQRMQGHGHGGGWGHRGFGDRGPMGGRSGGPPRDE